jgi:hypothetical protein
MTFLRLECSFGCKVEVSMKGDIGVFDMPNFKCKRLSRLIPHAIQDVIASKYRNLEISNIVMKHGSNAGDI